MTDEQLEAGIEAITAMLEARAAAIPGDNAKVVEGVAEAPKPAKAKQKVRRKRRKTDGDVVLSVGRDEDAVDS